MELGKKIAYYRKSKNITQDALAKQLGISNQAVSKWETDQSCPDVELLPKIADIFEITLDELFEREFVSQKKKTEKSPVSEELSSVLHADKMHLPWEDDETLHVALYVGHKLIHGEELKEKFGKISKDIIFNYSGPALNVESSFSVVCNTVQGNVTAGGYVECEDVGMVVNAGGYIECGDVGQSVCAGSYVECGDVEGMVTANSYVECGDIEGDVTAGDYVECGDIGGDVTAGDYVECGDVEGDVTADSMVNCGDVNGNVTAGGDVDYGN